MLYIIMFHLYTCSLVISSVSACVRGWAMFFRGHVCVLIIIYMSLFDDIHCRYTNSSLGCVQFSFSVVCAGKSNNLGCLDKNGDMITRK